MSTVHRPHPKQRVAILGGGVCGLYAGRVLAAAGVPVTIIERSPVPGGLAGGFRRGGNCYDLGVHMLHAFDREILEDVKEVMGDESIEVELDAKIRWIGRDFRYPLKFRDMVNGVSPLTLVRCVSGLLAAELRRRAGQREPANAEDALVQLYGRPLYEFFFADFTERYWGTPPNRLSATFVKTKMPRLTVRDGVLSALNKIGFKPKADYAVASALLNETLHYSRTGAEAMPRRLVEDLRTRGAEVRLGSKATGLHVAPSGGVKIEYECPDSHHRGEVQARHCISTIPLPSLVTALNPTAPDAIRRAATRLRYKPIVVYGLLVNKPKALDALYVYYRDRMFHRIGEPKNAGVRVEPADHTVLIVEMTCDIDDPRWRGTVEVQKQLRVQLREEGVCTPDQIVEQHILHCPEAYPIFSLGFERHLDTVQHYLEGIDSLQSTGRQGAFCYPNMHGSMRMGADAAHNVLRHMKAGPPAN